MSASPGVELWNRYADLIDKAAFDRAPGATPGRRDEIQALSRLSEEIAEEARKEEREACAKVAEEIMNCHVDMLDALNERGRGRRRVDIDTFNSALRLQGKAQASDEILKAIRSRSSPSPREPEREEAT